MMLFKIKPRALAMKENMPRINLKSMRDKYVNPKKNLKTTKSGHG